jgi:hypothetical protein
MIKLDKTELQGAFQPPRSNIDIQITDRQNVEEITENVDCI